MDVVGAFLADRALPVLGREPAVAVALDEVSEVERVVVGIAVHRTHWGRYLASEELATQGHLYTPDHRLLVARSQPLLELGLRLRNGDSLLAEFELSKFERQLADCKDSYEMVGRR